MFDLNEKLRKATTGAVQVNQAHEKALADQRVCRGGFVFFGLLYALCSSSFCSPSPSTRTLYIEPPTESLPNGGFPVWTPLESWVCCRVVGENRHGVAATVARFAGRRHCTPHRPCVGQTATRVCEQSCWALELNGEARRRPF